MLAEPVKASLRHAGDGKRSVSNNDFLADDSRVQIESGFPERPADDDYGGGVPHVNVFGADQAAGCGSHSESLEESSSYSSDEHGLRLQLIGADSDKGQRVDDQVREDVIAVAHDPVSGPRETVEPRLRIAGLVVEEFDELSWVSHRESTQQQSVDDAKNGRICTDAEGDGVDGNCGKTGRL